MKKTLAYDPNARQFKTDVEGKRFYLGTDATEAEDRKRKIIRYRARVDAWTPTTHAIAKATFLHGPATSLGSESRQFLFRMEVSLVSVHQ